MKQCSKCSEWKPESEFGKNAGGKDGLRSHCKVCTQKRLADYYAERREQIARRNAGHYQAHRDEHLLRSKSWYEKHRQQVQAPRTLSPISELSREMKRLSFARRRARKHLLDDAFTLREWHQALVWFNGACAYCQKGPSMFDVRWVLHMDHYIPLSDPACLGTTAGNIVPACQSCNLSKADRAPGRWMEMRFGNAKATRVISRIELYFDRVRQLRRQELLCE